MFRFSVKIEKGLKKTSTSVRLQTCDVERKKGRKRRERKRERESDIERER